MRRLHFVRYFLFVLLVAVFFSACKARQRYIYTRTPVEDKENHELFRDILASEFPFQTFTAKLNMTLTTGKRLLSSKANLRIVKDSALQLSIQPLFGVEMFRLHVDRDTVTLLDRMNKKYLRESIEELKEYYPVGFDYSTMQAMFTNALFLSGKERVAEADYNQFNYTQSSEHNYYLTSKDLTSGIDYAFTINGDDKITFAHLLQPGKNHSLQWGYSNFALFKEALFPHKMDVTMLSNSRKVDLELIYSDVLTDLPVELSNNIPNGYTKTSMQEILRLLSSNQ